MVTGHPGCSSAFFGLLVGQIGLARWQLLRLENSLLPQRVTEAALYNLRMRGVLLVRSI